MKPTIRILTLAALVLGTAAIASAAPRSKALTTLQTQDEFAKLKTGDTVLLVCNECRTVSEQTIESAEQAMGYCKEGSKVTCPMCKKEHKVLLRGRPAAKTPRREVVYVNDKGEECFFIAASTAGP